MAAAVHHDGLEVLEAGRALKVQTDIPHLVSLGGGRLSTAVTLHPLPPGRVTVGCDQNSDIVVAGTGVELSHCHIENHNGLVTLLPVAEMTSVDGVKVTTTTRLTQGSMICIGRSNYLRFNHPAEARMMKSILPNTRISMMPLNLYNGVESQEVSSPLDKKPPMAPRRSPRDSWGDVSNSSSCNSGGEDCCALSKVSKLEYRSHNNCVRHVSPKVFPAGSATVNSPASAVLGSARTPAFYRNGNAGYHNLPVTPSTPIQNGTKSLGSTPTHVVSPVANNTSTPMNGIVSRSHNGTSVSFKFISNNPQIQYSRSVTSSPAFDKSQVVNSKRLGSTSSLSDSNGSPAANRSGEVNLMECVRLMTPSPAFNRNPVPYSGRSVTPSPPRVSHRRTLSGGSDQDRSRNLRSPSPGLGSNCSLEELVARSEESELKRKQAQEERLREQEAEKQEQARLEEILSMCAEYDRQNKAPTTPTIPQNRIKTNGSLPRDKRLASPASEDEMKDIFTFETAAASYSSVTTTETVKSLTITAAAGPNLGRSPYENVVINAPVGIVYPQSPRTRIRTIVSASNKDQMMSKDNCEIIENRAALFNDYDFVPSLPRNITPQHCNMNVDRNNANIPSTPNRKSFERDKFIFPLEDPVLSERLIQVFNNTVKVNDLSSSPLVNGVINKNTNVRNEAREISNVHMNKHAEGVILRDEPQYQTTPEPQLGHTRKLSRDEAESLRTDRSKLLMVMAALKNKVGDIERQEEELLRELDMERALLDGEWTAQSDKLSQEEEQLMFLRAKVKEVDMEMDQCRTNDLQRQDECRMRVEAANAQIHRLEQELCASNLSDVVWQRELADRLKHQHEILDAERRAFEDLEFRQLEVEADSLSGREEIQRELSELTTKVQCRQVRLAELESQRSEAARAAQQESRDLERQLIGLLRQIEEGRNNLRVTESQLEELTRQGLVICQDSSPEGSSDTDEAGTTERPSRYSKQSQDDLDRISRVTSGAPMEVGTGSLGRKTLESLKEIERNRQIHLVQQGSMVIEEERKRVQELKRRVQDEVRAQWEERRQREANCNSLNSVGSEESSLTSSDVPTESAWSDEVVEKRVVASENLSSGGGNEPNDQPTSQLNDKMREKELAMERDEEETRPLSDSSAYEQQLAVRMRDKQSRLQQRPLTRYLPIRSETLNLRAHIESAGHQVDLCPHVSLDVTSCRGYLHKMGSKFHHWNKRWFVFDRSKRTLTYYSDRMEKKVRGGTYFQSIEEVYLDHLNSVKSPNPQLTFVVKTHERIYHLMAPSAEAMRIWVDVVFTGAEGYQEFEHGS